MALIGKVEEFQENDYWREYTERLGHFTANEITDAGKKTGGITQLVWSENVQANQEFSIARETNRQKPSLSL